MIKLTDKEKIVFYGLVRWPNLNDIELSDKIDVKRPTVTAIRNKLVAKGYFTELTLPNLGKIGCELLVARYGDFNPLTPWGNRERFASREPVLFYRISTDTCRISLAAAENFTEVRRYLDTAAHRHATHNFLTANGIKHVYFPLGLSKLFLFFDFAPLLNKHFNLGMNEKINLDPKFRKTEIVGLTDAEKLVLYAMVKYGSIKDKDIADKLSLTRQRINTIRQKIESKKLVSTVRFPDLGRLGFEIISFSHVFMDPRVSLKERIKSVEQVIREGSQYLIISGNMESILLSAFNNYSSFEKTLGQLISQYTRNHFLAKDPTIKIIPVNQIRNHLKLRCAPLVKKIFNIKKEI
ncbi:MAG: helix-turn-helix domain-containing protein [Methanobacteriota archaeon]